MHRDQLDSTTAITDESGAVVERLAYEPFGKRRVLAGSIDSGDAIAGVTTDRGFTNHEHLDEIGFIHMNGRVYDPTIGRFISADPYIQAEDNLQSYNRYAYVMNSPLTTNDPSGYFSFKKFVKSFVKAAVVPTLKNVFNANAAQPGQKQIDQYIMRNPVAYGIGQGAATFFTAFCGGCGGAAWASYYRYQSTGSITEAYKTGAIAYATNAATTGINTSYTGAGNIVANALVGCASSSVSGGDCLRIQPVDATL